MFGHYLHALTTHSPTQYELANLRSLNAENQERLFRKARTTAELCTNHHSENVIPQIMLRLQVKQEQHIAMLSVQKGDTQVSHIAKELPSLPVKTSFLKNRVNSWQVHLQRIAPFLVGGQGLWWTQEDGGFCFYDGDCDSDTRSNDTFVLLHYRHHSIPDVEERRKQCWIKIIEERIIIPATQVKVYDEDGISIGRIHYCNQAATYVPNPITPNIAPPTTSMSATSKPVRVLKNQRT